MSNGAEFVYGRPRFLCAKLQQFTYSKKLSSIEVGPTALLHHYLHAPIPLTLTYMTLTFNPKPAMVITIRPYAHTQTQFQRSVGSKQIGNHRTDRRTRPIALFFLLTQSVIIIITGAKFTKMCDTLHWTPMNRLAKFILGGEIRNRTDTKNEQNKQTNTYRTLTDISTPCLWGLMSLRTQCHVLDVTWQLNVIVDLIMMRGTFVQ